MSPLIDNEYKASLPLKWSNLLRDEFDKPYSKELFTKVRSAYGADEVFPSQQNLFRAFELCVPKDVRVVILGQDPYHTLGVADGLAFSSGGENLIPPSLRNIYKEIKSEYGSCPNDPDLTRWAKQGVLLLNVTLTVRSGEANSHADIGWHEFTDAVIRKLSEDEDHIVFMLWGNFAQKKRTLIDESKHLILESVHPSPLSAHRGFLGNSHFKKANEYLTTQGRGSVDWCN